ncbi:MAG: PEP-CTERM sorting domain-containing protein [Puniceicoccales bacterium]
MLHSYLTPKPCYMIKVITPLAALTVGMSVVSADTTWEGDVVGDEDNYYNVNNWSNGLPNNVDNPGTIDSGTPGADGSLDVTNNNGEYLNVVTGGTLVTATVTTTRFQNFSTVNVNGGTLSVGNGQTLQLGGDTALNLNGGLVTSSSGTATIWTNSSSAVINVNSATTFSGVNIWNRLGTVNIDNTTLTLGTYDFVQGSNDAFLNLQNGATLHATTEFDYAGNSAFTHGLITLTNGVNTFRAAAWDNPENLQFNFTSTALNSTIVIDAGFFDETEWAAKWADGTLTFDGGNVGSFGDYFTVAGDTLTLTSVPEPSTYALIGGILALALVMTRRRK